MSKHTENPTRGGSTQDGKPTAARKFTDKQREKATKALPHLKDLIERAKKRVHGKLGKDSSVQTTGLVQDAALSVLGMLVRNKLNITQLDHVAAMLNTIINRRIIDSRRKAKKHDHEPLSGGESGATVPVPQSKMASVSRQNKEQENTTADPLPEEFNAVLKHWEKEVKTKYGEHAVTIFKLHLEGESVDGIAIKVDNAERTIQSVLKKIRDLLESQVKEEDANDDP